MGFGRKAQAGAAVLIALIALLIILYVLFLPPAERAVLLGEAPPGGGGGGGGGQPGESVIFSTVPTIAEDRGPEVRTLPSFTVRTITSGNVLADRSGLVVERSAFHSDTETVSFSLPDNADDAFLSFSVVEGVGALRIALNEETIYDREVPGRQPAPLALNPSLLQDRNELRFSVSGVGFAIWNTNRYELANVRVTADVTSFAQADQTQRFVVSDLDTAERVFIEFVADCDREAGELTIMLNQRLFFEGRPRCGQVFSLDMATQRLSNGENTLSWSVDSGEYFIDDVAIIVERESESSEESFIISQQLYDRVITQGQPILMRLSFREPGARGTVVINGEELSFRTNRQRFAGPVTPYLQPGTNTVQITESTVDVTSLEVLLG